MLRHALANGRPNPPADPQRWVDVLVASKLGTVPTGTDYIPWEVDQIADGRPGWAEAANALLDAAAEDGRDAIFLDDDVTILPDTFRDFDHYYQAADVFGFRLRGNHEQGDQVGWGLQRPNPYPDRAVYIAHVTASLLYIKAHVLQAGLRFPVWPGVHFEDIAFTYECWLRGFRVAYLPFPALHAISPKEDGTMIGATKRHEPDLAARRQANQEKLGEWVKYRGVAEAAFDGRIPLGVWSIDP